MLAKIACESNENDCRIRLINIYTTKYVTTIYTASQTFLTCFELHNSVTNI